jgi:hypothetical protein
MLWTDRPLKRTGGDAGGVVRLDPPLHGACVNDAPTCKHGNRMATIKRDAESPSGLVLQYWRCRCVVPLAGAELFRCIREMRQAIARSVRSGRHNRGMEATQHETSLSRTVVEGEQQGRGALPVRGLGVIAPPLSRNPGADRGRSNAWTLRAKIGPPPALRLAALPGDYDRGEPLAAGSFWTLARVVRKYFTAERRRLR